jgi:hypothetical protein
MSLMEMTQISEVRLVREPEVRVLEVRLEECQMMMLMTGIK